MSIAAYLKRFSSAEKAGFSFGIFLAVGFFALFGKRLFLSAELLKSGEKLENILPYSSALGWILGCGFVTLFIVWLIMGDIKRLRKRQSWLIDATNRNITMLNERLNASIHGDKQVADPAECDRRWPWGNHHTEALGHFEAAAKKLWTLYDPSDFSTAPTNDMVAEWLQSERGVSRERARAITSMLRPDGLPTGPRR